MPAPQFYQNNTDMPGEWAVAVTPSDSVDLPQICRGLYVGVTGNVNVNMPDGGNVLFSNVAAGIVLPIRAKRVLSTSTTATNIVAIY